MSYIWYTPLGVLICVTVGMIASLVTGNMLTLFRPTYFSITFGNSYTMSCLPVLGDNPRALASGLSYVQVENMV